MGTATCRHLNLVTLLKVRGGEQNMLSEPKTSSPIRKRMRSSMALQVNSIGCVGNQVKMIRVEQDRQSVVLELHYGRHEADSNHATTWCTLSLGGGRIGKTQNHTKPTPSRCIGRSARNGAHTKAALALFSRQMTPNRQ